MRHLIAVSLSLLLASVSMAAEVTHVLLVTPTGSYGLRLGDGPPQITEYSRIIDVRGTDPAPPPDPEPPAESDFSVKVKAWAQPVSDPAGAQALALVYRLAAEAIADGSLDPNKAPSVVSKVSDAALGLTGTLDRWDGVRGQIEVIAAFMFQTGTSMRNFIAGVSVGLQSSADGAPPIDEATAVRIGLVMAEGIKASQ